MPKVMIPNLPTRFDQATRQRVPSIDINPAAQYGEFAYLVNDFNGDTDSALSELANQMDAMNPDDIILCVGDIVLIAAAIAYANDTFGAARILRWSRNKKSYDLLEITL